MKKYIILCPEKGSADNPCFWRADNCGYVYSPFGAGIYDEEVVKADPGYYNNGYNAVAIPLTDTAMSTLGFKCQYDQDSLKHFLNKSNPTPVINDEDPELYVGGFDYP